MLAVVFISPKTTKYLMSKPLNQLLEKLNPDVVKAAEQWAEKEIQELKTTMLQEQPESSQVEMTKPQPPEH